MTPLRKRLFYPPNAVADAGFHFKNGRPVAAPRKPVQEVSAPTPAPETVRVNVYPVTFSTHDRIVKTVCRTFEIRVMELLSERRNRWVAEARQVAMALTIRLTKHSMPKVGRFFERDHTTVLHAVNKMRPHIQAIEAHMPPESIMEWVHALKERLTDPEAIKTTYFRKTHCPKGHLYDEETTIIRYNGKRRCRICAVRSDHLRYERRKAARLANAGAAGFEPLIRSGEGCPAVTPDLCRPGSRS